MLDIAENAIRAGASLVEIKIKNDPEKDLLCMVVRDNGRGMDKELLEAIDDPFVTTRTERPVGLGLPLLKQSAQETGGDLVVKSEPGKGTEVKATFKPGHIDMKPLGDMASTVLTLVVGNPQVDFVYESDLDGKEVRLDTRELDSLLEGQGHRSSPQALKILRTILNGG